MTRLLRLTVQSDCTVPTRGHQSLILFQNYTGSLSPHRRKSDFFVWKKRIGLEFVLLYHKKEILSRSARGKLREFG